MKPEKETHTSQPWFGMVSRRERRSTAGRPIWRFCWLFWEVEYLLFHSFSYSSTTREVPAIPWLAIFALLA